MTIIIVIIVIIVDYYYYHYYGDEVLGLKAELRNAIGQATGQARI